jgi:nicotinamide riboside kinase
MYQYAKSLASEKARIERLLALHSTRVRQAVNQYVKTLTSETMVRRVADVLETQGPNAALDFIDQHVTTLSDSINTGFAGIGANEVARLKNVIGGASVGISFDPASPRAAEFMQQNKLDFVTNFTQAQKTTTRRALQQALTSGAGVRDAARAFRDSIGLTDTQMSAVDNYRTLLEDGNADALDRALRDRRYDRTVTTSIENDQPLTADQIDRMVDRYRDRFLALRADTIARTETMRVLNVARQEAVDQVVEDTGIDPSNVKRRWMATMDARTRDTHAEMDGQVVGMDEPFVSPSGAELMFPGDPSAPAEEVINCRCVVAIDIE